MKAKMCKVLSLTLAMVLAFTLIPARELAASTNEDTSTDTVQTEEEAPAENNDDPEEKKQDEEKDVQQGDKQPEEKTDEVAETTSATPDDDKKAPEPKNANQNRGTGDDDELAFVMQPEGGIVEPDSSLNISWEINFKPYKVELGYYNGGEFKYVNGRTYSSSAVTSDSINLLYNQSVTSDEWVVRAYRTSSTDTDFVDSTRFTITRGALKFSTQPEGGTVEPDSSLNISWEINFKPYKVEIGYFEGGEFKYVNGRTYSSNSVTSDSINLLYSQSVTSDKWVVRAYRTSSTDFVDSTRFTITRGALKFSTQPEGGTVEPDSSLKISWEINFKPYKVELGYYEGDEFIYVDRKTYSSNSVTSDSINLLYNKSLTSDKWVIRAYLTKGEDSDFVDSTKFTITRGALKFLTQPEGGTVEPDSSLKISWEINFKPYKVELGYYEGDEFIYVDRKTYSSNSVTSDSINLLYNKSLTSDKWVIRAYLTKNEDSDFVDSTKFTITRGAIKFLTQPEGGTVEPDSSLNISWETNFKPYRVRIGYYEGDEFIYVDGKNFGYNSVTSDSFDLRYYKSLTSDKWVVRAYRTSSTDTDFVDSVPFTVVKAVSSGACGNNLNWSYEDGVLTIDGTGAMYNYDDTLIGSAPWHWLAANITSVELGSNVTTIGNFAFKDCKSLKTIVIPESIRQIGEYSFYKAGLQSVTISSKLMLIPTGAFAENDLRNVTVPSGIVQINSNAFASNPNLWKVTFPSSLGSIGDCAFANCRINEIVLPEGLTSIGEGAFSNNKTVWGIKFPDSVTNIGARAFADCSALQKLEFVGGAPTIGSNAFSNVTAKAYYVIGLNGWDSSTLKNYGGTITWVGLQTCSEDGKLTWSLKDGVLTISGTGYMTHYLSGDKPGWYEDRDKIKSIIIMPGVARIGSHAFDDCTNVNTIIFYGSKPSFGFTPFTGITANAYYTPDGTWTDLPNYSDANITWIASNGQCGDNLFWIIDENKILHITGTGDMYDYYRNNFSLPWYNWVDEIVGIDIASGCTSIGDGAFYYCSKLESVNMPSTVKTIGVEAFYRCSRLSSINLSSALTSIGDSAFEHCQALSEINIPNKVTTIGSYAFYGCSSLRSVVIPDSVATLSSHAFDRCSSLESVVIGKGVKAILASTFQSCKNLAAVEFTGDVTAIYQYAFMGCSSLDYIELPAALKEIGIFAFSDCTSLSRIKIHDKLESIDFGVFSGCSALSEAFFYGTPEQWDSVTKGSSNTALTNIIRCVRAEGDCSKNDSTEYSDVMWRLFWNGELVIDGYGEMASYSNGKDTKAPWLRLEAGSDITKVVISDGVTSVGRYAFLNCSNITSVELPDTLAKIEENAFYECSSISEISIPENVKIIQNYAFYKCSSISSIRIPGGVTVIYASAFANCSALENVEIADGVRTIKGSAFYGCTSLVEINLPSSVTSIEMYAFSDCTHLVSIDLGGNVEFIGAGAFENCTKLAAITIPASVTTMQYRTFRNCSDLKTVIFEGNAIELSEYATPFVNVNTYAYYPADNSTWTESARQMYGETIKWIPYGEGDIIVKFSHSCSFSNNLSVNFYIPADEVSDYENYRLVVKKQVFNGSSYTWKETTLTDYTTSVQSGVTYLRFVYTGVAAKEMGDELEATLYMDRYGMTFNTTVDSYSVKEYAYNRLKYSDDDIFKTLLVDMLNYGAASQTYFKYNTGSLVNADLTSAQRAYASEMPELKSVEDYMPVFTADEPSAYFYGKSVVMGNNIELKYYMRFDSGAPADSVVLHVEYKTVSGTMVSKDFHASEFVYDAKNDAYTVKISDISAKDMCRSIDAALYDGEYSNDNDDNRISEIMTYSIESYVYNRLQKSTDEDFKALVRALIKYGKSAENYFKTH